MNDICYRVIDDVSAPKSGVNPEAMLSSEVTEGWLEIDKSYSLDILRTFVPVS